MSDKDKVAKNIGGAVMRLERATPGALLYKNTRKGEGECLTTIYLRKSGLTEPFPTSITIVVMAT